LVPYSLLHVLRETPEAEGALAEHAIFAHDSSMAPTTYGDVLARNIRAARSRVDLSQQELAARMRALGYKSWLYQTVGNVENGKRRVSAEEVFGLGWALGTSIAALMRPTEDDKLVEFPSGAAIPVGSVQRSATGQNDGAVQWRGEQPVFPESLSTAHQLATRGFADWTEVSQSTGEAPSSWPGRRARPAPWRRR
jgi:transcriptional regulator with XRE-family HTH domain